MQQWRRCEDEGYVNSKHVPPFCPSSFSSSQCKSRPADAPLLLSTFTHGPAVSQRQDPLAEPQCKFALTPISESSGGLVKYKVILVDGLLKV